LYVPSSSSRIYPCHGAEQLCRSQTSYFPAIGFYYVLNLAFPHYASLVAEAVTADDVDQSVGTEYDGKSDQEHDLSKETYEMSGLPQQHA
jgi:NCS1 family nucleobase:cation symporter-1